TMQKTGGSVLKRSRIFKSGINRRAMKAARESIALLTEEKQGKADYSSNYLVRKIFVGKHNQKSQSAMEYLMTYGWAILIIAVVLGALYSLGVFNSTNFAPKAPPGACQVFRPNGPGTTSFINLEGVCNGELPEYVANFNGQSSGISIPASSTLYITENSIGITMSVWFYMYGSQSGFLLWTSGCGYNLWFDSTSTVRGADSCGHYYDGTYTFRANTWYNLVVTVAPGASPTETYYVNGVSVSSGTSSTWTSDSTWTTLYIGSEGSTGYFDGEIANIQIYNTSLSQPQVQALYQEGIGGAPINLQNLVAWYPLNGNANDYSGNGNNGVPTNVMFVSNWYSGYTPP
ncbi:MAG: LamG-like jellyroll fold domain-containing protein, partial [Candidatus Micrarchaeia archaeon]